jgi:hypothetical protein
VSREEVEFVPGDLIANNGNGFTCYQTYDRKDDSLIHTTRGSIHCPFFVVAAEPQCLWANQHYNYRQPIYVLSPEQIGWIPYVIYAKPEPRDLHLLERITDE